VSKRLKPFSCVWTLRRTSMNRGVNGNAAATRGNDVSRFKGETRLAKIHERTKGLEDHGRLSVLGIAVNSLFQIKGSL
jgi:hypothetical protein